MATRAAFRSWVKMFADDPQHAFPGQGQMKPGPSKDGAEDVREFASTAADEAGSSSLLPAGGSACRADAREHHECGADRAAAFSAKVELKWIERMRDSRALTITPAGRRSLMETFALSI